jgi:DNA-directed RNA polymerase specialized sigma24 family protein
VDPEDVVQSAYKSFFLRYGEGRMRVDNWSGLWGLLTVITLRKCAERVAYHRAQCRDVAREAVASNADADRAPCLEVLGREPTPLEAAELSETVDRLLAALNDDDRPVIELSLQGYSVREISQRLDRVDSTAWSAQSAGHASVFASAWNGCRANTPEEWTIAMVGPALSNQRDGGASSRGGKARARLAATEARAQEGGLTRGATRCLAI